MSECLCTEMVRIGEGSKHFLGHASLLCSCHQPSPALRTMQRTRCCTVSWMVAEPTIPYFVIQLSYDWLYCRWCIVFQPHLSLGCAQILCLLSMWRRAVHLLSVEMERYAYSSLRLFVRRYRNLFPAPMRSPQVLSIDHFTPSSAAPE